MAVLIRSQHGKLVEVATLSIASQSPDAVGKTIIVTSSITVDDITIPSTVALEVQNGSVITVNSGATLTINGPFNATFDNVFAGSGTVAINGVFNAGLFQVFGSSLTVTFDSISEVYPEWYGAVSGATITGTGTDATTAIQAALNSGSTVVRLSGKYIISNLTIPTGVGLYGVSQQQSALVCKTASTGTIITDQGSAAGIVIKDLSVYGRSIAYTSGIKLGYGATVFDGLIENVRIQDLSAAYGFDITATNGRVNNINAPDTLGVNLLGTYILNGTINNTVGVATQRLQGFTVHLEAVASVVKHKIITNAGATYASKDSNFSNLINGASSTLNTTSTTEFSAGLMIGTYQIVLDVADQVPTNHICSANIIINTTGIDFTVRAYVDTTLIPTSSTRLILELHNSTNGNLVNLATALGVDKEIEIQYLGYLT